MKTRMAVGRCCCGGGGGTPTLVGTWRLYRIFEAFDAFGTHHVLNPISWPGAEGMIYAYWDSVGSPTVGRRVGYSIAVNGESIPSTCTAAHLTLSTAALSGFYALGGYATTTVRAYYYLPAVDGPGNYDWSNPVSIKGGEDITRSWLSTPIALSWSWAWNTSHTITGLASLINAVLADPSYLPGDDFQLIFEPVDIMYGGVDQGIFSDLQPQTDTNHQLWITP